MPSRRLLALLVLSATSALASGPGSTVFESGAQPRLAAAGGQRVVLAFGRGTEVLLARSEDGGASFGPATRLAEVPKLMLGMRRGPRVIARGDAVTVTVIAHELLSFHSADGGRTWSAPVTLNTVPKSAREGLHDLASGPDGQAFVTWLDLRNSRMEVWGASSPDTGRTWGPNRLVYRSPEHAICECCHPSAAFDADGNLAVMWRNSLGGARDLWLTVRPAGAAEFTPARKLGQGTWNLKACPMDGGNLLPQGGGTFASVWQRDGQVFFCPASGPELTLGPGKQPIATLHAGRPLVIWQQGTNLVTARPGSNPATARHATDARHAVLLTLAGEQGTVLAYEHGPAKASRVVVERL
jgi:hypothetical protein